MIRLFLVDDHTMVRDGIRALLAKQPGLEVVGEARHGQELLDLLPTTPVDVVVLDIDMPVLDGLATTQHLRQHYPQVRVLILSMLSHERYVGQLLEAGALGYALKNDEVSELVTAIQTVANGKRYLCSELGILMLHKLLTSNDTPPSSPLTSAPAKRAFAFSRRELEVLQLLADGLTTSEIADKLFTSKRTIETHRQNMMEKSHAKNAASLIKLAMLHGVLQ